MANYTLRLIRYYSKCENINCIPGTTQYCPAANLDRLWMLVSDQTRKKYKKNSKKAPVIDVSRAEYFKVKDLQ